MKMVSSDTMRYVFEYDSEHRVLHVTASGKMGNEKFHEVATTFLDELDKNECDRALFDYLDFTISDYFIDLPSRPKELVDVSGGRRIKMAGLVRKLDSAYELIEIMYVNMGFDVRIFTNKDDAMLWLLKTP